MSDKKITGNGRFEKTNPNDAGEVSGANLKKRTQRILTCHVPNGYGKRRQPGDLEIRIRPDGRVFVAEADEALLDVCQALDPTNPLLVTRRKAKSRNESRASRSD